MVSVVGFFRTNLVYLPEHACVDVFEDFVFLAITDYNLIVLEELNLMHFKLLIFIEIKKKYQVLSFLID